MAKRSSLAKLEAADRNINFKGLNGLTRRTFPFLTSLEFAEVFRAVNFKNNCTSHFQSSFIKIECYFKKGKEVSYTVTQQTFTCSRSIIETLGKVVKYVQS